LQYTHHSSAQCSTAQGPVLYFKCNGCW